MHFDDILKQYLGEFGRYQKIQYVLVCLPTIFTALHALSWTFTAAKMDHRCLYPKETNETSNLYKVPNDSWVFQAQQLAVNKVDKKERSCKRIAGLSVGDPLPSINATVDFESCKEKFVWDNTEMDNSAVRYWELVCDDAWIRALVQAAYYVGQFFGSLVLGPLSDKIGRKTVFFIAIMLQVGCGTTMAYVPWWPLFAVLRIGVGFAHPGIFMIAVVIGMELVGPSKRMLGGVCSGLFFAFGQVILGILAYGIRDFHNFQLTISLPALIFISYWWLVPESARWLLSQRRFVEADAILQRAAKINNSTLPSNWYEELDAEQPKPTSSESQKGFKGILAAYWSLFRTPNIRKRSILTSCICWPAVSMVYYGLAMNPGFMGGNNRLAFIVGGFLEAPVLILVLLTINIVGRKFLCMTGFLLSGAALFVSMIIFWTAPADAVKDDADSGYKTVLMVTVVIGKSGLTGVYAVLYIFTPELFPTTVRNTAMGLCSMIARVGAVSASFVSMYLAEKDKVTACMIFAVLATLGGIACIGLPETAGYPMLETITEAEEFGKNVAMFKFMEKKNLKRGPSEKEEKAQEELLMQPTEQPSKEKEAAQGATEA